MPLEVYIVVLLFHLLAIVFTAAAALFAWRVYRTPVRLGWF